YQAYPPEDLRQHWGHAVSSDLIHWRDLPYAIYPGPEQACFSGSTLVENDRVIAMYHGTQVGNLVAVSNDPLLLNWVKITDNAVIPIGQHKGVPIYDPCIWKQDGYYYSLSGSSLPTMPAETLTSRHHRHVAHFLFRSPDLKTWEYLHPFVEGGDLFAFLGDDGACPYFWPIGDRYILLHTSHMSGPKYLLGDYDLAHDKFIAANGGRFAFGALLPGGLHAPSAAPDGQGGVIVIFNVNAAKPTPGWDQIMSLPRRLYLSGKNDLYQEPAGDYASLRYNYQHKDSMLLTANQEYMLPEFRGNTVELIAEFDPVRAPMLELDVLCSAAREEHTRICFYPRRGFVNWDRFTNWDRLPAASDSLICLDSSYSSVLPDVLSRAPETAPVFLGDDEPLRLHVFIDRSIVEVFVNDRQCVALRVYPGREDSLGIALRSQGRDSRLRKLDLWQMHSIYEI
ncbi:MAG: glycoside hydrolase family 32 protein, partial [Anaerolineae bacterium]